MSLGAEVDSSTAPTVAVEAEIPSFLALVVSTCAGEGGGAGYLRSANVLRPKSCASLKFGRIEGLTTVADNVNLSMPLLSGGSHLLVTLSNTLLSDNCFSRAKITSVPDSSSCDFASPRIETLRSCEMVRSSHSMPSGVTLDKSPSSLPIGHAWRERSEYKSNCFS